jgi:hypothetical protein
MMGLALIENNLPHAKLIPKLSKIAEMFWRGEVFLILISSQEGLSSPIWAL